MTISEQQKDAVERGEEEEGEPASDARGQLSLPDDHGFCVVVDTCL